MRTLLTPVGALAAFEWIVHAMRPADEFLLVATAVFFGLCALAGIVYTIAATLLVQRFFQRAASEPSTCPPVTIVKPLHGDEWKLLDALESFFRQDYPGAIQFLFGVENEDDLALASVRTLTEIFPEAHITVVVDPRLRAANRKVSNLLNMMPSAVHDWLVFADSDVQVPPNYLRHVIGELQKPGVGLVTCVYRGRAAPGFWACLSSQWITYSFLPSVITGVALKIAQPCFGQTIGMRRATLDRIGGWGRFGHLLVEDDAIGRAVRSAGEAIAIPPIVIGHTCGERDAATLTMRELRWSVAMRRTDPFYHLGSAITQPLPLALTAYALSGGARWSWLLVASAAAARVFLKLRTDAALHDSAGRGWLLPVRDIYSFLILIASYFTRRVVWRGHWFDIGYGGILRPGADEDAR